MFVYCSSIAHCFRAATTTTNSGYSAWVGHANCNHGIGWYDTWYFTRIRPKSVEQVGEPLPPLARHFLPFNAVTHSSTISPQPASCPGDSCAAIFRYENIIRVIEFDGVAVEGKIVDRAGVGGSPIHPTTTPKGSV